MGLFLAQLCMFITSQKMLENSISFEQIFFNTSLKVSQKNKCISIVVLLVFNFKNASRLYEHPIYARLQSPIMTKNQYLSMDSINVIDKSIYLDLPARGTDRQMYRLSIERITDSQMDD